MAKRVNIKQLKEESDGIIYYIVPNAKTLLKAGYIYCGYIMNNEDINNIYEDLLVDYSLFGNELDLMISYCKMTKEVYDAFVNDYCEEFGKTNEEIQNQIKESVRVTKDEKGKNISHCDVILYHGYIFKSKQTEFKEYFIESANSLGCMLKFIKYSKDTKEKEIKTKETITKAPKIKKPKENIIKDEVKSTGKSNNKSSVKENIKSNEKENNDKKENNEKETKPSEVKEDTKIDLVQGKKTKSRVLRKPKQIIDDDLLADEPKGETVKEEVKEVKKTKKEIKNEKSSDQPKKVSLSHKPVFNNLDDNDIVEDDNVEDDSDDCDFEEINNAPKLN